MNVFYTNRDPVKCAEEHCVVHQNKMIVEYAQLLSTAHHVLDGKKAQEGIYHSTHENHPSAVWVRESSYHYTWLHELALALCELYLHRTGKVHKTQEVLSVLSSLPRYIHDTEFKEPPVCAPEYYSTIPDTCKAYQCYLNHKFQEWSTRDKPIPVEFWRTVPSWVNLTQ